MSSTDLTGWRRRAVVWPAVLLGTPLLLALSPGLFTVAFGIDLLTGPRRLRTVRLLGMGLNYLVITMLGLLAGFGLWIATGFGLAIRSSPSQRSHHRVQLAWTRAVFAAVQRWLGARVVIDDAHLAGPGPVVVLARHASFFDAVVPTVVIGDASASVRLRHVLKSGLRWEPCLDLFGSRLPNVFVNRGEGRSASTLQEVRDLASDLGSDAAVIFPEGTFRTARTADAILETFREEQPERAERLRLRHLLPPRPGGVLALLDGAPEADVVIIGHTGFEQFGSFRAIVANTPFRTPVHIRAWRMSRSVLDADPAPRLAVIDREWQRLDDWIESGAQEAERSMDDEA